MNKPTTSIFETIQWRYRPHSWLHRCAASRWWPVCMRDQLSIRIPAQQQGRRLPIPLCRFCQMCFNFWSTDEVSRKRVKSGRKDKTEFYSLTNVTKFAIFLGARSRLYRRRFRKSIFMLQQLLRSTTSAHLSTSPNAFFRSNISVKNQRINSISWKFNICCKRLPNLLNLKIHLLIRWFSTILNMSGLRAQRCYEWSRNGSLQKTTLHQPDSWNWDLHNVGHVAVRTFWLATLWRRHTF